MKDHVFGRQDSFKLKCLMKQTGMSQDPGNQWVSLTSYIFMI